MKIVIADSYAALPGDLDWSGIEEMGECVFYEYTRPEDFSYLYRIVRSIVDHCR